jgi:GNAT superfamily N-acetyltransferase
MGLLDHTLIVGADHPSLHEALAQFNSAIGELHRLDRSQPDRQQPEHYPGMGLRLVAMYDGQVVGAAQMTASGLPKIIVLPEFRGKGLTKQLSAAWATRAQIAGYEPVLHSA